MKEAGHEDSYKAEDGSSTASLSQSDLGVLSKENSLITTAESTGGLSRMQQLSVEKKLKSLEPVMYFYDPPSPRPLSMCFDYTGTNITHVQIRLAIMNTLENIPNAKVTSLQFVARNVILGTIWVDNRWIVGLSTKQCVTVLMGRGIVLNGEPIKLRKYDDIIKEEYDKFVQHKERFSKKGGKKSMKHTILPQTNALSLLDKSLQEPSMESPITEVSTETVDVSA